jgi:hypothetical protein
MSASKGNRNRPVASATKPARENPLATRLVLVFGCFLGLAVLKFGNPVILDKQVGTPGNLAEVLSFAWPARWAYWGLLPLLCLAGCVAWQTRSRWPVSRTLAALPLLWLGWQFVAAFRSVDGQLTSAVLWHFVGCVGCYGFGVLIVARERALPWVLVGLLAAFSWCLVRAVNQRVVEFPRERADLVLGEQTGWTNYPPELVAQMRAANIIVTTNGLEVANPHILAKYAKGRVHGTLVYPNALAGLILLLLPVALAIAFTRTGRLRGWLRGVVVGLTVFLGAAGLFWSGSKLGWLVAVAMIGVWLLRFGWPRRLKVAVVAYVVVGGLALFVWRFENYLTGGAKSLGARFDYWQVASQVFVRNPVFGSGPGTFQRPYADLKSPESEMARLVHNDYLEQFSDSGLVGGLSYLAWIFLALIASGRVAWQSGDVVAQAGWLGLAGWFAQGIGEFGLYVPALAWSAFTLLGTLLGSASRNAMDTNKPDL